MGEITMDQAAAMIDADERGEEVTAPPQEELKQDAEPKLETAPAFDESKMKAMFEEMLNQQLSRAIGPIKSELGKFRQVQSEFDRFKNQINQPQVPRTWQELDPQSQQATDELLKHRFGALFADELKAIKELKSWQQEQVESRERETASQETDAILRNLAGDKYSEVEPLAGKIFLAATQAANMGDESAQKFISELYATESGKYRLAQMALAEYSRTLEAKAEKVKGDQANKAKKVSTGVGGQQPPVNSQAPKKGSKEWQEMAAKALDEAYSQG
jgi:hypothetical protein